MQVKISKQTPKNNKALNDKKIQKQPVSKKMISSDMEEKMAASYADSRIVNETENCSVSQDNDLNQLKSRNESEDGQQINQVVEELLDQNDNKSINWNMIPSLNQSMGFVANSVLNQDTNEKQSQESCSYYYSYYSEESAKKSANKDFQRGYSSSPRFDNTSREKNPSDDNDTSQRSSYNINGFFHPGTTTANNQNLNPTLHNSSDSFVAKILPSREKRVKNIDFSKTSIKYQSNQAINEEQLPTEINQGNHEEHQQKKSCCSIM